MGSNSRRCTPVLSRILLRLDQINVQLATRNLRGSGVSNIVIKVDQHQANTVSNKHPLRPSPVQVRLRLGFVLVRRHLVGIDPHHQVKNVVVDSGEPVAHSSGDHDHVPRLELVRRAVANRNAPLPLGHSNSLTFSLSAGRRFQSTISGPVTSVADPSRMW